MDDSRYIESEDYYDMACEWLRHRDFEKAESCLRIVIDHNPKFIYAYIDLANIYAMKMNFHDAIAVLRKAIKFDPEFDRLYYLISKYAFKNADYKRALKSVDRALEIKPTILYEKAKGIIEKKFHDGRR